MDRLDRLDRIERRSRGGSPDSRGQTGFDFLVGMSVFLITVGFIFTFAPGMFEPFTGDTGPHMIVADRGGNHLAEDLLVESPERPGVLNETCTVEFFDDDGSDPSDCRFDTDDLNGALGVDSSARLNVTIRNGGSVRIVDGTPLRSGPPPDPNAGVTTSQRLVSLSGTESDLVVRVW